MIDNFHQSLYFSFSLPLSLLLPHSHLGVLEGFSLQINLVSDLDAWSDFLDIPKKAFDSLPLYRRKFERETFKGISYEPLGISFLLFDFITCFMSFLKTQ
jgi:hypothetical protein